MYARDGVVTLRESPSSYYLFLGFIACLNIPIMPRSHIHGAPRQFYYGLNLTDDPGNANFRSPIRMHHIRMIKYNYV